MLVLRAFWRLSILQLMRLLKKKEGKWLDVALSA